MSLVQNLRQQCLEGQSQSQTPDVPPASGQFSANEVVVQAVACPVSIVDGDPDEAANPNMDVEAGADDPFLVPPAGAPAGNAGQDADEQDEHQHYSSRAPWLRAFVLGANDGLVTVASLMLGVGGGTEDRHTMMLSGVAGLVAGALSMACGEYVSVSSQRDAEEADIEKEAEMQRKGPRSRCREFQELVQIYVKRGLSPSLAYQVAKQLSETDVVRTHARDELGIDMDNLANPTQASLASAVAFSCGAGIPLLAGGFIKEHQVRTAAVATASTAGLLLFGLVGAWLGGARKTRGALRVLIGGMLAMVITFYVGHLFGA